MSALVDSIQALRKGLGGSKRFTDSLTEVVLDEVIKASGVV